jgi:competence protein ComEC
MLVASSDLRPDILVGHDGQLIAVRGEDRRLAAVFPRGSRYELERWLEHDGDARSARQASETAGFRCDSLGCTASVKGKVISIARHPAATIDDCQRANMVITGFPRPANCRRPELVIDVHAVRANGTHAIRIERGELRITTVAGLRGNRPWSRQIRPRTGSIVTNLPGRPSRLQAFAAPQELGGWFRFPRSEGEEDDEGSELRPDDTDQ